MPHRGTPGSGSRDALRVVGATTAVLVLCAVVGVASGARSTESVGDVPVDTTAAAGLVATLSYLLLIGFLALAVRFLVQLLRRGPDDEAPEEPTESGLEVTTPLWLQRLIVAGIVAACLLTAWLTWLFVHALLSMPPPPADATGPTSAARATTPLAERGGGLIPDLALLLLALLGAALLVLGAIWLLRRSAGDDEMVEEPVDHGPPLVELDGDPFLVDGGALERMEPRAAVIACFAAAQRMLWACGTGAEWDETAAEHVHRVAASLPGAAPPALEHLLALYHEAKFSEHPVTAGHRRDAVSALLQLRGALGPVAARELAR